MALSRSRRSGAGGWDMARWLLRGLGRGGKSALVKLEGSAPGNRSHLSLRHFLVLSTAPSSSSYSASEPYPFNLFCSSSSASSGSYRQSSRTMVPTGTVINMSSPRSPPWLLPCPFLPLPAFSIPRLASLCRDVSPCTAWIQMLPPVPPSPPFAGPFSTYFSRRKDIQPWPPAPACNWIEQRSVKGVIEYESGGGFSRSISSASCSGAISSTSFLCGDTVATCLFFGYNGCFLVEALSSWRKLRGVASVQVWRHGYRNGISRPFDGGIVSVKA